MALFEGMGFFEWGVLVLLLGIIWMQDHVGAALEQVALRKEELLVEMKDKLATLPSHDDLVILLNNRDRQESYYEELKSDNEYLQTLYNADEEDK